MTRAEQPTVVSPTSDDALAADSRERAVRALLRVPPLRRLWSAQLVGGIGDALALLVLVLLSLQAAVPEGSFGAGYRGAAFAVAAVFGARILATLLFGAVLLGPLTTLTAPGGPLDRRWTMIGADGLRLALLVVAPLWIDWMPGQRAHADPAGHRLRHRRRRAAVDRRQGERRARAAARPARGGRRGTPAARPPRRAAPALPAYGLRRRSRRGGRPAVATLIGNLLGSGSSGSPSTRRPSARTSRPGCSPPRSPPCTSSSCPVRRRPARARPWRACAGRPRRRRPGQGPYRRRPAARRSPAPRSPERSPPRPPSPYCTRPTSAAAPSPSPC